MTDTALLTDGARPAVRLERHLADPPPVVWRALTEREQLRSWFPSEVIVDGGQWEVGATITFEFGEAMDHLTLAGEVLEVDEPNLLVFTWGEDTLRFELSPEASGTRLVLIDELPVDSAARKAAGWENCLDRLAGIEPAPGEWQARYDRHAAAFEPVVGPQKPPPVSHRGDRG